MDESTDGDSVPTEWVLAMQAVSAKFVHSLFTYNRPIYVLGVAAACLAHQPDENSKECAHSGIGCYQLGQKLLVHAMMTDLSDLEHSGIFHAKCNETKFRKTSRVTLDRHQFEINAKCTVVTYF